MTITRSEFWTAAGVVVAAIVGGASAGYLIGKDTGQSKTEALTEDVKRLEKINKGINVPLLLGALSEKSQELGDKTTLMQEVAGLRNSLSLAEDQKQELTAKIKSTEVDLKNAQTEVSKLKSLVFKEFSNVQEIIVSKNRSYWIAPGIMALGLNNVYDNSANITITSVVSDKKISIGERVDFVYKKKNCFVLLIETKYGEAATFSMGCS